METHNNLGSEMNNAIEEVASRISCMVEESNRSKIESDIILKQLGQNKFITMTGAKHLAYGSDKRGNTTLSMQLMRGKDGINSLTITYNKATDSYDLTFARIHGSNYTVKKQVDGVYAEDLRRAVSDNTGLALSL